MVDNPTPADWVGDMTPITASDWTYERARHLLDRAGFGGTPDEITRLYEMGSVAAVSSLVDFDAGAMSDLPEFSHSPIYDPTLRDFPETRPAATRLAAKTGAAMGVSVKPMGPRPLQPVVDRFFFWLRASTLETCRLGHWWAECMLLSKQPLQEKMALFWHGHFATGGDKVRDYRKMQVQIDLLRARGTGNFRTLVIGVAQDPAMLVFLDAGRNVKGALNENFGREVMELFLMGVGNYTEQDVREAARAFTGWIDDDLSFRFDASKHDARDKTFLGHTGPFDGVDVLDIILSQPVTAVYIASKIYRFFVRDNPSPELQVRLGAMLRNGGYEIAPFLRTIFLSRDFYSPAAAGAQIKGPVELIVSTYRRVGLTALPGIPDINSASGALGQVLLNPPTVAGWAQGRAWITPATLIGRGNFAREVMFPDQINFVDPNLDPGPQVREVNNRILRGADVATATTEEAPGNGTPMGERAMANAEAEQEDFNTRLGSLHGWQEAVRKVKPIVRAPALFSLTEIVAAGSARTTADAVDILLVRLLSVPVDTDARTTLIAFLDAQLGTSDLGRAQTYLEEPLRLVAHLIMSRPEYQLV
jgi:uncharacterized protein (DUF1800 family)